MNGQQLRSSILQEAIAGSLVSQDPADEPASKLLRRINSKAKLLQTEQPLPQGWCACSVSTIADIFTGDSVNKEEKEKKYTGLSVGYNYIATKDVGFDGVIDYDNGIKIPFKTKFKIAHKGSTLLCIEGGSAGRKIGVLTEDVCFGNKLCAFEPKGIDEKYLYYYLQSPTFVSVFKDNKTGMIGGVKRSALAAIEVLVPPLAEQKRIVEKIEELMPLVDEYENAQEEFNNLNAGLKSKLRASLLQEAIAGRLVPQDPRDEPASELLHRIGSKATLLETEQSLPRGWCATTLSVLCELTDGEYIQNRELINLDAKFLRGQREGNRLKSGRILPAGSLVILVDGENSGEVFKTPIEGYQGSTFKRLVINKNMYEEFVLQVINSHRTKLKKNKVGSAIPHLNKKLFSEIEVLVPPLAEQKRIVAKIEELFAKLDALSV